MMMMMMMMQSHKLACILAAQKCKLWFTQTQWGGGPTAEWRAACWRIQTLEGAKDRGYCHNGKTDRQKCRKIYLCKEDVRLLQIDLTRNLRWCEWRRDVANCLRGRGLTSVCADLQTTCALSICGTDILLPCLWPEGSLGILHPSALNGKNLAVVVALTWTAGKQMTTWLKSKRLYVLPWMLFIWACLCKLPLTCGRHIVPCLLMRSGEHTVPSIIDGQGQRARRRRSTQPDRDRAAQSDSATHDAPSLSFSFDTHNTLLRASSHVRKRRWKWRRKNWGAASVWRNLFIFSKK